MLCAEIVQAHLITLLSAGGPDARQAGEEDAAVARGDAPARRGGPPAPD